jgi:hypothetical protein
MTQDEIIEMAKQAGIIAVHTEGDGHWYQQFVALEAFAKLVAAKHDPKIAIADAYRAGVDSGIAAEREACAKVCDELHWPWHMGDNSGPKECAEAIRTRGEA